MIKLSLSLFLIFAYISFFADYIFAQDSKIPIGWKKENACQLNFLISKNLKNQKVNGIDSCLGNFRSSKLRLVLDFGWRGSPYKKNNSNISFKEKFTKIVGKVVQIVTNKTSGEF